MPARASFFPYLPLSITLLAFVLRVANLDGQSLWYDEAASLLLAREQLGTILERSTLDNKPPLYYWLLHVWGTGPPVGFYPRFFSVLAGTLAVPLTMAVARRLFGDSRVVVVTGLFVAVSPYQVFYSQEARMYALIGVATLLAAYGFLRGWNDRRRSGWVLYAAGMGVAVYAQPLSVLPAAALVLWAVGEVGATRPWRLKRLIPPAAAVAAVSVAYLPWFGVLLAQAQRVFTSFWAPAPTLLTPVTTLYAFYEGPFVPADLFALALTAVLLPLALTVPSLARGSGARSALGFLWVWGAIPLLALLALSLVRSVYLDRVVFGASYPVYLLLAWFTVQGVPALSRLRWLGPAAGLLLVAVAVGGLSNWYRDPGFSKVPYGAVATTVREMSTPGTPVLHTSDGSHLPFLLHAPDLHNHLLLGDPDYYAHNARAVSTYDALGIVPVTLADAVGQATCFVLVVALDHNIEYQASRAAEIDARYQRVDDRTVEGVVVRLYETHETR